MFDKDRFHNQLALNLGYQRIVNDKRINILLMTSRCDTIVPCSLQVVNVINN